VSDLESHNDHFDNSQTALGATILIPSYFTGKTDAIIPYVLYPSVLVRIVVIFLVVQTQTR
jgi:hypothetical protein